MLLSTKENHFVPIDVTKNYNGIDLIKFLCAFLVFIIHVPPFQGELSAFGESANFWLQHFACRLAVPFYFVSSGFFLFKKMPLYEVDKEVVKTYCFKILRLLGTWHVLLFIGEKGHLWYLGATVIAVILVSLCFRFRIKLGYIYAIASTLYLLGLFGDSYYGIIEPLQNIAIFNLLNKGYRFAFATTRNGVFMGFIFVLMGATFSNCRIRLKARTAAIGFLVSMLGLFAEVFLLKHNNVLTEYNLYVFLLPTTFFLFSFATSIKLKDNSIYRHLRNIGIVVYFAHRLVNNIMSLVVSFANQYCNIELVSYQFILSLSVTLLIAVFIDWLSHRDKFKWVNWIFA